MIKLAVLRRELKRFLGDYGLKWKVVDNDHEWAAFNYLYTSIVSEVELIHSKDDLLPKEVESMSIRRLDQQGTKVKLSRWTVKLNGRDEAFTGGSVDGQLHIQNVPDLQLWTEGHNEILVLRRSL